MCSSCHAHSVFTFCVAVWRLGLAAWLACVAAAVRPPDALRRRSDTERTCLPVAGRLSSHRHTRYDKTVVSVSCLAWRCELDNCYWRVLTSNFLSATVLSCRESSSHRRGRQDADRTVLSGLVWQCELGISERAISFRRHQGYTRCVNVTGSYEFLIAQIYQQTRISYRYLQIC